MKEIELLAPGGDIDSIKAAILAGANAVYCGLDKFNARNRAANISFSDLNGILKLAHQNNCKVFLTLNIIIVENEIRAIISLLNKLVNTSIDGIIIQDLGMFYLLSTFFKSLKIHASTQLTTHNKGQINFLSKLNATQINLSRELNINEISDLTNIAHQNNILAEVFVHGSNCISFSGLCYISSVHSGNSGNRGRCSQPCRDQYLKTDAGKDFPLNLKDNSAYFDLKEIAEVGVDSIKIEGRIKKFHYVYTIVDAWRKQVQTYYEGNKLIVDNRNLYKVFNRDFSNAFLKGEIDRNMFIDNPRDHSAQHRSDMVGSVSDEEIEIAKKELYDEKTDIINFVKSKIDHLSIEKAPLMINVSGKLGTPLKINIETPDKSFFLLSEINLEQATTETLNHKILSKRLSSLNETEYLIEDINLENLQPDLFLSFNELSSLKKRLLFVLNGSRETIDPIEVPKINKQNFDKITPSLSVLISSKEDVYLSEETSAKIYYQLPNGMKNECSDLIELFQQNKKLIAWFPAVLIGEDYTAAIEFLQKTKLRNIVTNNTGIAFEAFEREVSWIAGPFLNIVNSFSLINLKENFNCKGAFISNEINKVQIKSIKKPDNFDLYYSIYHPIVQMTSRQCLFHQVIGCEKSKIEESCIKDCEKYSSITNLKENTSIIEKSKGNYHHIYNDENFLNTEIVSDIQNMFSGFLIDLRKIVTQTQISVDKLSQIIMFEELLKGNADSDIKIKQIIYPTTNSQYKKGI
ncbi:MAG: U32 family peptidase [Bacteroidetes bacterium]|nr:U32 family peptidase [Bacteroidota bacterium]